MLASTPLPWYRQFWPWFLIAIPASSVVAGIWMIWIASNGDFALVDADYYQSGLDINQRLARDRFAHDANLQANLLIPGDQTRVSVYLLGSIKAPAKLQLNLTSPKDSERDRSVTLLPDNGMLYRGPGQTLVPGHYSVELLDAAGHWRLSGQAKFPGATPVQLASPLSE